MPGDDHRAARAGARRGRSCCAASCRRPRAASRSAGSTPAMPATVLRRIGSSAVEREREERGQVADAASEAEARVTRRAQRARHHDREEREARDRLDHARDAEDRRSSARRRVTAMPSGTLTSEPTRERRRARAGGAPRVAAGGARAARSRRAPPSSASERRRLPARRVEELARRTRRPGARAARAACRAARAAPRGAPRCGRARSSASAMSCVTKTTVSPSSRADARERLLQAVARRRVERAEGLVEQQESRLGRERAREADALLLAARELVRPALAELAGVELDAARAARRRARARAPRSQPRSSGVTPTFSATVRCGKSPTCWNA